MKWLKRQWCKAFHGDAPLLYVGQGCWECSRCWRRIEWPLPRVTKLPQPCSVRQVAAPGRVKVRRIDG